MDQNETNFITDKEYIRGVIRKSVVSHDHIEDGRPSLDYLAPMTNVQVEFWQNFQANGGKILRCHTRQDRLDLLRRLAEDQQYNAVVCTHNNLCPDLEQAQMNYVNTLSTNTPMDAVVALSTTLVARTGSIGFTQPVSRFLSMRNIAKDVIVISRMIDIVPDIESALDRNKKFAQEAGMEFVTPSVLPKVDNKEVRTPQRPRYILLLLDERPPQHA
ncbi:MAG: lactate utilization protein [Bacteroidales bacterium]|nr:lactate utilization protein [Bacteroidales bacterium]